MRKLLLFIAGLSLCCIAWGPFGLQLAGMGASGGGVTYLVDQNFEGTGYDNDETWSESGYVDEDYTTTALRGIQSCLLGSGSGVGEGLITSPSFTAQSEVWGHFRYRPVDAVPTNDYIFNLLDSTDATIVRIYQNGDGTLAIRVGTTFVSYTTQTVSADTLYHIFFHYKAGAGSNAEGDLWIETGTTRGTADLSTTSANGTESVDSCSLYAASDATYSVLVDQVLISAQDFSSVAN